MWSTKKQNDQEALRPEVFTITHHVKREKDIDELTVEEKLLATGSETAFWTILKGHIENEVTKLEQLQENAMLSGMSEQEIGRNTIVISLTKGIIKRIISVVKDAKEAQDGQQPTGSSI